jgi:predicted nucleic acid-binding protein
MTTSILVDANVLLDVMTLNAKWFDWSRAALKAAAEDSRVVINPIVYAEISTRFSSPEELDAQPFMSFLDREDGPWPAAFLAGRAHVQYRRRGGIRTNTLPDFFIGAHAVVSDYLLLTRDTSRFETCFPTLRIIEPDTHP